MIFDNVGGQFEIVVYGFALIVVLLFLPKGVAGSLADLLPGQRKEQAL